VATEFSVTDAPEHRHAGDATSCHEASRTFLHSVLLPDRHTKPLFFTAHRHFCARPGLHNRAECGRLCMASSPSSSTMSFSSAESSDPLNNPAAPASLDDPPKGVGLSDPHLSGGRRKMLDAVNNLHSTGYSLWLAVGPCSCCGVQGADRHRHPRDRGYRQSECRQGDASRLYRRLRIV
jgi:hypothetical protein